MGASQATRPEQITNDAYVRLMAASTSVADRSAALECVGAQSNNSEAPGNHTRFSYIFPAPFDRPPDLVRSALAGFFFELNTFHGRCPMGCLGLRQSVVFPIPPQAKWSELLARPNSEMSIQFSKFQSWRAGRARPRRQQSGRVRQIKQSTLARSRL